MIPHIHGNWRPVLPSSSHDSSNPPCRFTATQKPTRPNLQETLGRPICDPPASYRRSIQRRKDARSRYHLERDCNGVVDSKQTRWSRRRPVTTARNLCAHGPAKKPQHSLPVHQQAATRSPGKVSFNLAAFGKAFAAIRAALAALLADETTAERGQTALQATAATSRPLRGRSLLLIVHLLLRRIVVIPALLRRSVRLESC